MIGNITRFNRCWAALVLGMVLAACSMGGEVVKITSIEKGSYGDLKASELKKLEEIRQITEQKKRDSTLNDVLQSTSHYSATEYIRQHPSSVGSKDQDYRVGGYDVLNIVVYEEADLSREAVRVSADGNISFPLIGRVKVEGLTTSGIEGLIAYKLAKGQYLLDAHVSVIVADYKSKRFMVLGAVNHPGSYSLQSRERIIDAISRAGGIIRREGKSAHQQAGAGKKVMIIRTQNPGTPREKRIVINIDLHGLLERGEQNSNLLMADEDVLYIPQAEHFFIIGQVRNTGSYPMTDEEITLVEAISMAGGFTLIAARNKTALSGWKMVWKKSFRSKWMRLPVPEKRYRMWSSDPMILSSFRKAFFNG